MTTRPFIVSSATSWRKEVTRQVKAREVLAIGSPMNSIPICATTARGAQHGERGTEYQRLAILHHSRRDALARRQTRRLRSREAGDGYPPGDSAAGSGAGHNARCSDPDYRDNRGMNRPGGQSRRTRDEASDGLDHPHRRLQRFPPAQNMNLRPSCMVRAGWTARTRPKSARETSTMGLPNRTLLVALNISARKRRL